jgi:hypothetical protein
MGPGAAIPEEFVGYFTSGTELPTTTPSPKIPFFGFTLLCQQGEKMWLQRVEDKEGQELLPGGGSTMLQELHALFYRL